MIRPFRQLRETVGVQVARMRAAGVLLCALTLAACDGASDTIAAGATASEQTELRALPTQSAPSSGVKVAFLGDSISAGLHLPAEQAFPALLQKRLAARGQPFELLNGGVSGDTSAGGLRRVDWLLKQSPKLVVIELGANDGMRGVPPADIEANLRAIVEKVQNAHAQVLLLGMRIPPSYGKEYVAELEAIYPRLAEQLHLPFVPFFMEGVAGRPELNLPDGLHPTPAGHVKLAQTLEEPLLKLLREP